MRVSRARGCGHAIEKSASKGADFYERRPLLLTRYQTTLNTPYSSQVLFSADRWLANSLPSTAAENGLVRNAFIV